jgi:hypothetical protein
MSISVTCQCGARLEIDEKFLGKEVPCPDCQRPLPTKVPPTPPPLDLPDYRRTSGLAVLSLTLALVGAFTIVGTIAAVVVGLLAIKEIAGKSSKLEGLNFARAGIILGAIFTVITLAALISPTVFGLDAFLRQVALAGRVSYPSGDIIESTHGLNRDNIVLTRPSRFWGAYLPPNALTNNLESDDLIIMNIVEDAYIACQTVNFDGAPENEEEKLKKILERFYKSELVNLLGRLGGNPLGQEATIVDNKLTEGDAKREVTLDMRLGGINRRFLLQFPANERNSLTLLVGAARRSRFERFREDFRKTFDSKKTK